MMLKPSIAMLDEIDSGLDVDALRIVSDAIIKTQEETDMGLLIVSHYARFYEYLKPTHAHVLLDGKLLCLDKQILLIKLIRKAMNGSKKNLVFLLIRKIKNNQFLLVHAPLKRWRSYGKNISGYI